MMSLLDTLNKARVVLCCSVLQCVAVCCSVILDDASAGYSEQNPCCSVLQCVAMCGSVLQCVTLCCSVIWDDGYSEQIPCC